MSSERSFDPARADLRASIRLEASAGTGKTYNLERVVCELIARYEIPLREILVVTFTNKAARELRERIRQILTEQSGAEGARPEEERLRLQEARHCYDQAAIYTIHGFCQHVLQAYPFESRSPFRQEFLSDSSLVEEGVRDHLHRRFRRIPGEDLCIIRGFLEKSDSLEDAVSRLVRITMEELDSDNLHILPEEAQLDRMREELRLFRRGEGAVREALRVLMPLRPGAEEIAGIFKTLKTGQRKTTAEKIARIWDLWPDLPALPDLPSWLDWFFSSSSDLSGVPADVLILLSDSVLTEKSRNGASPAELPDRTLTDGVTALFEALEPFCDPGRPGKGVHRELLGYSFLRETVENAAPLIADRKKIRGMRDFSDLIRILHEILTDEPEGALARALRKQYRVVLVDEFQDTDRKQWDIFRTLFGTDEDHNYFLIGDPKQSIYGFRGADLSVYFQACDGVTEENRYSLGTNYRSRRDVVEGCNFLFDRLFALPSIGARPVPFQPVDAAGIKAADPVGSDGRVLPALTFCEIALPGGKDIESKEALKNAWMEDIADRIAGLLTDGTVLTRQGDSRPVRAGDTAVLMDTNGDCESMQKRLESRGISSVIYSERRVLDTPEAEVFGQFLKTLAAPSDRSVLGALLLSPAFSLPASGLRFLEESDGMDRLLMVLQDWKELTDRGLLIRVFHKVFEEENLIPGYGPAASWKNRLLARPSGDRSCTNLVHLAELFHQEQKSRGLDARELYDHFLKMKNDPGQDDQRQVRLDKDGEAVQILTHHSSKGLEFPVVFFCGGMQDGTAGKRNYLTYYWEDRRIRDYLVTEESKKKHALSDWEERKRLYYVSFTRASSLLYLPFFPQGKFCYLTSIFAALCGDRLIEGEDDPILKNLPLAEQWPFHSHAAWKSEKEKLKIRGEINRRMGGILRELAADNPALFAWSAQEDSVLFPAGEDRTAGERPAGREDAGLRTAEWKPGPPFSRRIISVESFSSLTAGASHTAVHSAVLVSDDADRDSEDRSEAPPAEPVGALSLTRGAEFGNLVHHIFETMEYSLAEETPEEWFAEDLFGPTETALFLEEASTRFFDQTWWQQNGRILGEMIWNVLRCPIGGIGSLVTLGQEDRKHELEFLLRIPEDSRMVLGEWSARVEEGYLKGFIDLIFRREGKLYIADWKTTVPAGPGVPADYEPENLEQTMKDHHYDVQAAVYALALRRYMESMDPSFDFDRDFGGVYYFFVRGMGPDGRRGVWFDRPDGDRLLHLLESGGFS